MKHLSWRYRRRRTPQEQREFSDAQARRVSSRWARVHEAAAMDPARCSRTTRLTIEDSHRMRLVVLLRREPTPRGWSRAEASENGKAISGRFGVGKLARLLARLLARMLA